MSEHRNEPRASEPGPGVNQLSASAFGDRARSGTRWIAVSFGLGQVLRLAVNITLAALLVEEAFALMAIVLAVMFGLAMFSDIGLKANVVQHERGDDPDFLNTAWTLQVIRGVLLFVMTLIVAWPLSKLYGANDPKAQELLYLVPIAGLGALVAGFESAKIMTAARHLRIKEVTKIEVWAGVTGAALMLLLAFIFRSVYALAIGSLISTSLQTLLSYHMLEGPKSRFRWQPESIKAIFSFGKWVFFSTFFTFSAFQIDRLAFGAMFPLNEVGVYSIAASLAIMVPSLISGLQHNVLFPWYSRMLAQGTALPTAFDKVRPATLIVSTYLCTLLVAGSTSFFELAYDERYALGGVLLPALAIGAWFACLDGMYNSAFLASGKPKWTAISSASKVMTFILLLIGISLLDLSIAWAAAGVVLTELARWLVSSTMGRRLGLRGFRLDVGAMVIFLVIAGAGWYLVHESLRNLGLHPFWRLALLGTITSLMFTPAFLRFVLPLIRKR